MNNTTKGARTDHPLFRGSALAIPFCIVLATGAHAVLAAPRYKYAPPPSAKLVGLHPNPVPLTYVAEAASSEDSSSQSSVNLFPFPPSPMVKTKGVIKRGEKIGYSEGAKYVCADAKCKMAVLTPN